MPASTLIRPIHPRSNASSALPTASISEQQLVLPKYVNIRVANNKHYLRCDDGFLNASKSPQEKAACRFEVVDVGEGYVKLKTSKGETLQRAQKHGKSEHIWLRIPMNLELVHYDYSDAVLKFVHTSDQLAYMMDKEGRIATPMATDWADLGWRAITDREPILLRPGVALKNKAELEIVDPIISKRIHDVRFNLSAASAVLRAQSKSPLVVQTAIINNDSTVAHCIQCVQYQYQKSVSGTWNDKMGTSIGSAATFHSSVPCIKTDYTITMSATMEHEWGTSEGTTATIASSTEVEVPAGKKAKVTVIVQQSLLEVEFSYKQTIVWLHGETETFERTGIYKNLESYLVEVKVENWESIEQGKLLQPMQEEHVHQPASRLGRFRAKLLCCG
jgi:hypothetical protein